MRRLVFTPVRSFSLAPASRLGELWTGHDESELAFLHSARTTHALCGHADIQQRFSASLSPRVRVVPGKEPIANLQPRTPSIELQQMELGLAEAFNRHHQLARATDSDLPARMQAFENRLQYADRRPRGVRSRARERRNASIVWSLSLVRTKDLPGNAWSRDDWQNAACGLLNWSTAVPATIGINTATWPNMPATPETSTTHRWLAPGPQTPRDARRDLGGLDHRVRRTPGVDGTKGRGHHSACFSSWLAGGGARGGITYGSTDELGATVAEDPVHVHDFHATIFAPARYRSHTFDLSTCRARFPIDRCPW